LPAKRDLQNKSRNHPAGRRLFSNARHFPVLTSAIAF
jgi:hypothetical protein